MTYMNAMQNVSTSGGGFSIFGTLKTVLTTVSPVLGTLVGQFGSLRRATLAYGTAVGATSAALTKAAGIIREAGNSINTLRALTGMSARGAGGLVNTYGAFGIGAGQTASMFGGLPLAEQRARAAMFGAGSWNDLPTIARNYQRMDPIQRNAMLGDLAMPEMQRLLMTPENSLRRQMGFQAQVQGGMGVDPGVIARTSQELELVTNKFRTLGSTVLTRFGSESLPRLIRVFDNVADRLAARSNDIGTAISRGVDKGFDSMIQVAEILTTIPPLFFSLTDSVLSFGQAGLAAVPVVFDAFLTGVSVVQNGIDTLSKVTGTSFANLLSLGDSLGASFLSLVDKMQFASAHIQGPFDAISKGITNFLTEIYEHPMVQRMLRAAPAIGKALDTALKLPEATENTLLGLNVSPEWAAAGGLAAWPIIGKLLKGGAKYGGAVLRGGAWAARGVGSLLGLGGASAATAASAGASSSAGAGAMFGSLGVSTAATTAGSSLVSMAGLGAAALSLPVWLTGGALGIAGYEGLRKTGILGQNMPSSWQMFGHYTGLFGPGRNGGKKTLKEALAENPDVAAIEESFNNFFSGMKNAPRGSWSRGLLNTPNTIQGAAANAWGDLVNTPRSSWANALESKYGDSIRGGAQHAGSILAAMQAKNNEIREGYNGAEVVNELRKLNSKTDRQIQAIQEGNRAGAADFDRVRSSMLLQFAKESGATLRMAGSS